MDSRAVSRLNASSTFSCTVFSANFFIAFFSVAVNVLSVFLIARFSATEPSFLRRARI